MVPEIFIADEYNYSGRRKQILVERKIIKTKEGKLPKHFDPASLDNLFVDQFVTWDEVHRKVITISDDGYVQNTYKNNIMKFPRKDNGKLEVSNGTYSREKLTLKKYKYMDFFVCVWVLL